MILLFKKYAYKRRNRIFSFKVVRLKKTLVPGGLKPEHASLLHKLFVSEEGLPVSYKVHWSDHSNQAPSLVLNANTQGHSLRKMAAAVTEAEEKGLIVRTEPEDNENVHPLDSRRYPDHTVTISKAFCKKLVAFAEKRERKSRA